MVDAVKRFVGIGIKPRSEQRDAAIAASQRTRLAAEHRLQEALDRVVSQFNEKKGARP